MAKMQNIDEFLADYKSALTTFDINQYFIPVNLIEMSTDGVSEFNRIYEAVLRIPGISIIVRTPSGAISRTELQIPSYDIRISSTVIELTLLTLKCYRFQFRSALEQEQSRGLNGSKAFVLFRSILQEQYNIDLEEYTVSNGAEIKKTIKAPRIELANDFVAGLTFEHVHHIDFHSSYPAGLANTHPEFRACIEDLFNKRHEDTACKAILNYSIGFMQSIGGCQARYAILARDAIHDNNARVDALAQNVTEAGRFVLCYNTDGFWYTGDIYHGDGEGVNLGEWSNDHIDCKWRAKSAGSYEYIEDGQYYPIVRGRTRLDTVKPRVNWEWGDILKLDCEAIKYSFTAGKGIEIHGDKISEIRSSVE